MPTSKLYYLAGAIAIPLALLLRLRNGRSRTLATEQQRNVVVITGGCSGLGFEIACYYVNTNSEVAILDVREESASPSQFAQISYYKCDVSKKEQVERAMNRIEDELGTPTILINCAAMTISNLPFHELSTETFAKTINVNLLGAIHTVRTLLPRWKSKNAHVSIVNVSSVVAHLYPGGLSDYAASKAALSAFHHCLEAEARYYGYDSRVKFFLVEVGQMDTPLFSWIKPPNSLLAPLLTPQYVAGRICKEISSGRGKAIRLPAYASWVCVYDVLPVWVQRRVRSLMGIDDALMRQDIHKAECGK